MGKKQQHNPPVNAGNDGPAGRDVKGRFLPGNKAGQGNLALRKVHKLRKALLDAVSTGDIKAVIKSMVRQATKGGDAAAAKVILERYFGKPTQPVDMHIQGTGEFRIAGMTEVEMIAEFQRRLVLLKTANQETAIQKAE